MMNLINKKNSIITVIVLLVVLSWSGIFDKYSQRHIDDSIKNTAIVYASARGINAAVSILQSSEFNVSFFAGFAIQMGEVLDPINDSIERFSEVVFVALSSLVLQRILVNIVPQDLFNGITTVFAIGLIISLYFKRYQYINFTSKGFLLLMFTKFLFVATITLNTITSSYLFNNNIDNDSQKLKKFQNGLSSQVGILTSNEKDELKQENKALKSTLPKDNDKIKNLKIDNDAKEIDIKQLINKKDKLLTKYHQKCKWYWFDSKKCDAIDEQIAQVKIQIDEINKIINNNKGTITETSKEIRQTEEKIKNNQDKIDNKSSTWQKVKNFSIDISDKTVEEYIDNLFNLIVLLILKTILFPLGFLFLLIKGLKRIWHLNWLNYLKS